MTSKGIPKNKDVGKDPFNMNTNEKFENAIAFAQAIETAVSSNMTREMINALIVLKPSLKEDIDKLNALLSSIVTPTTTATATITTTASTTVPSTTPETTTTPATTTTSDTTTTAPTRFQHPTIQELYVTPGGQLFCGEKKLNIRNNSGYAVVHFTTPEKGHVTANAARLAYEAANNVLLTQKYIMQFKDGDKMNIRPDNMYIVERTAILPQNKHTTATTPTTTTTATTSTTTTKTETTSATTTEIEGNVYNHPEIEGLVVNDLGDLFFNGKKLKKIIHGTKYIVWVKINGKRVSKTGSRLIYEAVNNVILDRKSIIGYKDGDAGNLKPENLYAKKPDGRRKGSGVKTIVNVVFSASSSEGEKWCTHPTYTDVEVNASTGEIRYKGGEAAPILDKGGYPNINLGDSYKNASKIIYEAVHGCTLPDNVYVGPIDGDKYNLSPSNLRINPRLKGTAQERVEKVEEISELIRDHAEDCESVSSILRLITRKKPHIHTSFYFVDKMLKGGFSKITEKYFSVVKGGKIVPVTNDRNDINNMSRDLVAVARKQGIDKAHEILLDLIGKGSFEPNMADMAIAIIENMYDDCHKVRTAAEIQKVVLDFYGFNTPLFLIDSIRTKTKYRDIIESMVK